MKDKNAKLVGAKLDKEHRDMLAAILAHHRRTIKGQLELWIEGELRYIETHRA